MSTTLLANPTVAVTASARLRNAYWSAAPMVVCMGHESAGFGFIAKRHTTDRPRRVWSTPT